MDLQVCGKSFGMFYLTRLLRHGDDMKLLVVLVNYNTTALLSKCLDTLAQQQIDGDYRVVVVDNHSSDGGAEDIAAKYPSATLLRNETNEGYAKAVNQAIREFNSEYILVLNPDIEVKPGAINRLLTFMRKTHDAGIVGGKLLNPDGSLQYSCRTFYTLPILLLRRTFLGKLFPNSKTIARHLMSDWDHNSVREVDWMLGACLMIRRDALREIGLMDERFFLYFEDVDWCYRMKKSGWKVYYLPEAEMIHHHRRDSAKGFFSKSQQYHLTSMVRFYAKWGTTWRFLKTYRVFFAMLLFLALDVAAVNASFYAAHLLREQLNASLRKAHIPFVYYYHFRWFINAVVPLVFGSLGLYRVRQGQLWVDELFRVGKGVIVASLLLMAGSYLVQGYVFSRAMIALFAVIAVVAIFALRWGAISCYHAARKLGFFLQRTLIVGTGSSAEIAASQLRKHREIGLDIVGFVRETQAQEFAETSELFPILGDVQDLPYLIEEHRISEIILATSSDERELVSRLKQRGVNVRLMTDFHSLSMHDTEFEELAGIPMVFFKGTPLMGMNLAIKRALDIAFSVCALLVLSPILAAIALLIVLESPGPVIFKQQRVGRHRRLFTMYKFRSMCRDAERMKQELRQANELDGPIFKIRKDPRHTRVGRVLRKFSLDELPQFWNVLKGDMSLVGPRPPIPQEVAEYDEWALKRLDTKPGITGLWQVSGRNHLTFEEMLKLDVYYIWNWSLSNDIKILLRTVPVVIFGHGAY